MYLAFHLPEKYSKFLTIHFSRKTLLFSFVSNLNFYPKTHSMFTFLAFNLKLFKNKHSNTKSFKNNPIFQMQTQELTNLFFKKSLLDEWADFYPDSSFNGSINIKNDSRNVFQNSSNLYVYDCTFKEIKEDGNGGVIFYYSTNNMDLNLLIEHSSFIFCTSTQDGGAIYIYKEDEANLSSILSSVCGYNCRTGDNYSGQFLLVNTKYQNQVIDSSVTLCEQKNAKSVINLRNSYILCKGLNLSNNMIMTNSGIEVNNPRNSSISFSSFRNNTASQSVCIYCRNNSHEISYTNIIDNEQKSNEYGIIYIEHGELKMNFCSILGNCNSNTTLPVFCALNGSSIGCFYCSLSEQLITNETIKIIEASTSFINYYKHLNLEPCKAGIDSWGSLFPKIPEPTQPINFLERMNGKKYII